MSPTTKTTTAKRPPRARRPRYATLGFQDVASRDDGSFWPTAWAVTTLTAADTTTVAALVTRAVG